MRIITYKVPVTITKGVLSFKEDAKEELPLLEKEVKDEDLMKIVASVSNHNSEQINQIKEIFGDEDGETFVHRKVVIE